MPSTELMLVEKMKASYPAVYLLSPEGSRSRVEIKRAAEKEKRKVYTWTLSGGLVSETARQGDTQDPAEVLTALAGLPEDAVFVLRQFHHYLEDPLVQILLLDLIPIFKATSKMLIILTPVMKIPVELEKDLALMEATLPDEKILSESLDGITNELDEDKKPSREQRKALIHNALGLTTAEAENAFALSAIRPLIDESVERWDPKVVMEEKCAALKKEGLLEFIYTPKNGEKLIGGLDNLKDWISRRKRAFSEEAIEYGLGNDPPRGIITVGPPGTGKSLGAKAFSSTLDLPLLRCDIGNVFAGIVGASEANMRRVIQTAERMAPCLLWIDEIEKGLAGTGGDGSLDSGVGSRVLASLLTWMSEKTSPVFIYATSNEVESLDEALLRRFDAMFSVLLPNVDERVEIFEIHLKKRKPKVKLNIKQLAEESAGFSGAEIEKVIVDAMYTCFDAGHELNMVDLGEAIFVARPMSKTKPQSIKAIEEWCKDRTLPANKTKKKTRKGRSVAIQ